MPAQGQGGAELVPLPGVVVDDVEDHLESGPVQCTHHRLELAHLLPETSRGVADVRRQKGDRVVAPEVGEPLVDQVPVVHEVVDRHQFDRGDAQFDQVIDDRVRGQPEIGPAEMLGHARVTLRHATHMGLVNHRLVPRRVGRPVVVPRESRVHHQALGHGARRVTGVEGKVDRGIADGVAEELVTPTDRSAHRLGVRVDQQLAGIEPVSALGVVRSVDPVPVQRPGAHVGQVHVPDVVGLLPHGDRRRRHRSGGIVEEAQLHRPRALGEEGEIDPLAVPGGAERVRSPGPDPHASPLFPGSP